MDFKWDSRYYVSGFHRAAGQHRTADYSVDALHYASHLVAAMGSHPGPPFISALILATLPAVVMATETLLGSTINPVQIMLLVLIVVITMGQAIHGTRQS